MRSRLKSVLQHWSCWKGWAVEAREANLPIRLRVLAVNPAKALYERLGFVVVEMTPERQFMEGAPF
jgi:hypothetical protein